jgi:hypothetical protein
LTVLLVGSGFDLLQLSGSTANYTINLTGIILLGLALSAAVTLWAYLHTLFGKGYGGSYGGSYAAASTYTDTYAANTYKVCQQPVNAEENVETIPHCSPL